MNNFIIKNAKVITPEQLYDNLSTPMLMSTVILPSQYQSYCVCIQFARDWFLEKFPPNFFNNVHINGKLAFDDFSRFDISDAVIKRENPLLAIIPEINTDYNRNWIDSSPEIPFLLRRTKMEGSFFNDIDSGLHVKIDFKTILMNFTYKIRLNTRAEQLDMIEFIKLNHRAGYTETRHIDLDIHVPSNLISQVAHDAKFELDKNNCPKDIQGFITYFNSHSFIPLLYKYRPATGNNEFFIRVPNCCAHLIMQMPSKDDGERVGMDSRNYIIEFPVEIEMTAPYCYTYYSQYKITYINNNPLKDNLLYVMECKKTEIPKKNEKNWALYMKQEYVNEDSDLGSIIEINLKDMFEGADIEEILNLTIKEKINPAVFIDFKMFNNGDQIDFDIDWNTLIATTKTPIRNITTIIAVYLNLSYVQQSQINIKNLQNGGRIS